MMSKITYTQFQQEHFDRVIALGNAVHGDNYIDRKSARDYYEWSFANGINASFVSLIGDELVGFRLTFAAQHWQPDQWCSPNKWSVATDRVCYFKCNTVSQAHRGAGIGSQLLKLSIEKSRQQGALAGLAHIWLASPGNSAFRYFSKCGGEVVTRHPGKWRNLSIEDGYRCPVCPDICECVAAEMLLTF